MCFLEVGVNMEVITIRDIARLANVSVSTVSRAINSHSEINDATKQKVMDIIKEYNYVPNNSARNLKRSDSKTIAVLIKGIGNPFFTKMIKVIEEEIQKNKYFFILHRVRDQEDEIDVAIQLEKEKRLKGIIFLGGYLSHSEEKLKQLEVPFVLATAGISNNIGRSSYAFVAVDDKAESYKMVDYLCKANHKKIAIIAAGEKDKSIGYLRLEGYKQALADYNLTIDEALICRMKESYEPYSMENGYEVTKELLASKKEFTALYVISDNMAIGACKAILDAGKKIPEDYSVAGFDGLDLGKYYNPGITTIRQPVRDMAKASIKILFDMINKKQFGEHRIFQADLVVRNSTRELE